MVAGPALGNGAPRDDLSATDDPARELSVKALCDEFVPLGVPAHEIRAVIGHEYARYTSARIRTFVPILAHRAARAALSRRSTLMLVRSENSA